MGGRARLRTSVLNIRKYYLEGEKIGKLIRSTCKPTSFKPYLQTHSWTWKMDFRSQASVHGAGWGREKRTGLLCDRGRLLPQARAFLLPGGLRADGRWWAHGASRSLRGSALQGRDADREAWRQRRRSSNGQKRPSPPRAQSRTQPTASALQTWVSFRKSGGTCDWPCPRTGPTATAPGPGLQPQPPALEDRGLKKSDLGSLSPARLPVSRQRGFKGWRV